jgi:hypothetical protein
MSISTLSSCIKYYSCCSLKSLLFKALITHMNVLIVSKISHIKHYCISQHYMYVTNCA